MCSCQTAADSMPTASPHFLDGPSPPLAPPLLPILLLLLCAAAAHSLLRVFSKCAAVIVVALSDAVSAFSSNFSCVPYCILYV